MLPVAHNDIALSRSGLRQQLDHFSDLSVLSLLIAENFHICGSSHDPIFLTVSAACACAQELPTFLKRIEGIISTSMGS